MVRVKLLILFFLLETCIMPKFVTVTVVKTIVDTFTIPVNGHFDETDADACVEYAEFHNIADYSDPETLGDPEITVTDPFEK